MCDFTDYNDGLSGESSYFSDDSLSSDGSPSSSSDQEVRSIACQLFCGGKNDTGPNVARHTSILTEITPLSTSTSCGKAVFHSYADFVDNVITQSVPSDNDITSYKDIFIFRRQVSHPWNVRLRFGKKNCQGTLIGNFKV